MVKKVGKFTEIRQQLKFFLCRCICTLSVLTALLLFPYISTYSKYGFSRDGKLHHSYLDYPNEIASSDAIELSKFMESLEATWKNDEKIYYPFDKEIEESNEKYWVKEIDVKDRYKRSQVIHDIAKEMGLSTNKFPSMRSPPTGFENKIKEKSIQKKVGMAFPSDYLKIKQPPRTHLPQCDITKLIHHKSRVISFSSQQFRTTNIKLDGLFSDGGKINIRTATAVEDATVGYVENNIKLNLTLYGQSDEITNEVSMSQIENEGAFTKSVHIHSHRRTGACLLYNLDIIFPAKLASYKNLNIKANYANRISGDLKSVVFKKFTIGLGRGAIHLENLKADNILIGALNGIVLGNYLPMQTFGSVAVKGATNIELSPQSKYLKSTVVTLDGPVKTIVTNYGGVSKSGGFIAHCWLCEPEIVSSLNPEYIHITSSRRQSIKIGYFEERTSVHINIHSKYGNSKLVYT